MRTLAIAVCGFGCVSSYQSPRVLPAGKTQVTVAVTRVQLIEDNDDDYIWVGDFQLRHGLADQFDGAIRLARTPGAQSTLSMLTLDPKFQITAPSSSTTVSVALPFGVAWEEAGTDFRDGVGVLAPTVLIGAQLTGTTELVFAPKVIVFLPEGKTKESGVEVGASLGLRLTNAARTWAVHPELSFLLFKERGANEAAKIFSFGIAVSAGN